MICALVAPEHWGSDLLLRTNCVSWILIILFASPAWHGFVIYPSLEVAEEKNLRSLQLTTSAQNRQSPHGYALQSPKYNNAVFHPIQFHRFRERWKKWYLLSNSGTQSSVCVCEKSLLGFNHVKCIETSLWPLFQTVNMLSEAQRTSGWCKSISAHLPLHQATYVLRNSVHFCWHGKIDWGAGGSGGERKRGKKGGLAEGGGKGEGETGGCGNEYGQQDDLCLVSDSMMECSVW